MSAEFFTACERLLSATANGVYQGVLIALLAGLTLRLFGRTNAATRHAVWFGVLLFVAALIPAHLLLCRTRPDGTAAALPQVSSGIASARTAPGTDKEAVSPALDVAATDSQPEPSDTDTAQVDDAANDSAVGPRNESATVESSSNVRPGAMVANKIWPRLTRAILEPLSWNLETSISLPHSVCLCLVSVWALLAALRGALIARQIDDARHVKSTSSAPSHDLQILFERLRDSLAARRNVRLRISSTHRGAVVLGFIHPVVLLPEEMTKDVQDSEVEHVLRHELAHVDRRDDWGNLAQQIIQAALFFHPAVWWISARLSLEREIACDDYVLEASGRPRAYALTLANIAGRMNQCRRLLAPGVSNNNSQLQQRITMILNTHRDRSPRLARSRLGLFTTATAMLAVLAINAGPRLVLAQSPATTPAALEPENAPPPPPVALIAPVAGVASVALVAPAAGVTPVALVAPNADAAPAALPPDQPGAESGPRSKDVFGANDYAPRASALQNPQAPPEAEVPPAPPAPDMRPVPPAPPADRPWKENMSVEERLDRIEHILEDLRAQGGIRGRHHTVDAFTFTGPPLSPPDVQVNANIDFALKRAEEEAKRGVEQAQRAAEAGQRAAEQAMRDLAKLKNKDMERLQLDLHNIQAEGPKRELEALRSARESLERQMQRIEQQIKRLEDDQNRHKKGPDGRPDDSDDGPKHDKPDSEDSK